MEGVLFLNTIKEVSYKWGWNWNYLWFIIPFIIGIYVFFFGVSNYFKKNGRGITIIGLAIIIVTITVFIGLSSSHTKIDEYKYQVMLTDNVNVEAFREQYEILEQQGITYIVRQK